MRVGDKELVHPIVFFGRRGLLAAPAAFLRAVFAQGLAFDIAAVRKCDHHVGGRDQVFGTEVKRAVFHQAAARTEFGIAEFLLDGAELFADDGGDALGAGQDVEQVVNLGHHLFVFRDDFVLFQSGQTLQAHLQNFLRLRIRQTVQAVGSHAVVALQPVGAVVVGIHGAAIGAAAGQHLAHQLAVPGALHQLGFGHWRRRRIADDRDEVINIGQRNRQAFQHMAALACLAQIEHGAPCHHFAAVLQEYFQQVFEVAQLGLAVDQRDHVHAKAVLQLRLLVQVVEHHFGHFTALEFDHQPHAGFVGLVLDVADAFYLLFVHQLGHALLQGFLVHLVWQLVDDDGLARALVDVLEVAFGPHHHAAAPGAVTIFHAVDAVNDASGRKVRCGDDFHQLVNRSLRVAQQMQTGVDYFVQVVRRDVGGHSHRNAARAIHQQIGQARWHNQRLFLRTVVVGSEVHGLFVQIRQNFMGNFCQPDLGVTHGRGVVAIDRTEVALAVDQHVAHREILRHAHNRVVDRLVAVGVVFADDVAHDTRGLFVGPVPIIVQLVHRKEHTPVHGLEAVAGIGQGPAHNHAHCIVQVAAPHFLFEADGQGFFGKLGHNYCC